MTTAVRAGFEALLERHQDELYRYLVRLARDEHTAHDLLQDTFLRAFRSYGRLDERDAQRAWLYRIAHNLYLNSLRRRPAERLDGLLVEPAGFRADDPAVIAEGRETLAAVERALARLPLRQRAALLLRRVQDLTYTEVGAALGCSEETARAHVYQAARKLRLALEEA